MNLIYQHHLLSPNINLNETVTHQDQMRYLLSKPSKKQNLSQPKISKKQSNPSLHQALQGASTAVSSPAKNSFSSNSDNNKIFLVETNKKLPKLNQNKKLINSFSDKHFNMYLQQMNQLMNLKIKARREIPAFLDHFQKESKNDRQQILRRKAGFYGFLPGEGDPQKLKYIKMRNSSIALKNIESDHLILQNQRDQRQFRNVINRLIENQKEIKQQIKNSHKFQVLMRQFVGQKSDLQNLYFPPERKEIFQDNINEELIINTFSIREPSIDGGQMIFLEKIPIWIVKDLDELNDKFQNYLEEVNAQKLKSVQENILNESWQVNQLKKKWENDKKHDVSIVNFSDLRLSQNVMRRFQPDKELQGIENKWGDFKYVSKKQRNLSMIVNNVVDSLNIDLQK